MINIAVVGLGNIFKRVINGINHTEDANVYMVVSRDTNKAKLMAKEFNVDNYGDFDTMLTDKNVHLVYLCTPNKVHFEQIKACLAHKKHVICEKPMVVKKDELIELFKIARENNCFLMEAEKTLFSALNTEVIDQVKKGIIGDVIQISANYCYDVALHSFPKTHWCFDKETGGSLVDVGVYPMCFALLYANSKLKDISGYKKINKEYNVDFFANANLKFENGVIANITSSWYHNVPNRGVGYIYGTKGYIQMDAYWKNDTYTLFKENNETLQIKVSQASEFTGQIQHACDCIKKGLVTSPFFDEDLHLDFIRIYDSLNLID